MLDPPGSSLNLSHQTSIAHPPAHENVGNDKGVALGCPVVPFQGEAENPHAEAVVRTRNVDHPRLKCHGSTGLAFRLESANILPRMGRLELRLEQVTGLNKLEG